LNLKTCNALLKKRREVNGGEKNVYKFQRRAIGWGDYLRCSPFPMERVVGMAKKIIHPFFQKDK
jgi:hypothetical protein